MWKKFNLMNLYYHIFWSTVLILASILTTNKTTLASAKNTSLLIDSNNNNSYKILVEQAENLAKNKINQEFKNNPEITEITITILGERQSQIVPILRSKISRAEWQKNAEIDNLTRYFADAKYLLNFDSETTPKTQPKTPESSPQIPAPPPPSPDTQPIVPQPQKSPQRQPTSKPPIFPSDEDDPKEIDD
ncbi:MULTISPECIES: hypothetical protein [Okeania]|uniref:Uncharacterized protein n=2 Tax=Okeania TaxID=1458928 RepID=A0A3N6P2T5_9CYAN|nr:MULTISPECIES: hypothetical protein [Okeania]NET16204.1 hypothetical protein [Okeania sp. SIO1H6]NET22013.1 hypothetical protein [Okeania sp. SIO1H5]NET78524.1 hypothetical protein [Okeania sp. SIO1F9]NET96948.1 hypothetical protein [Okeania sp. SIO1H2]RQH25831.1 hypothetical protein D5R40_29075 [Okeania hirsuta]